MLCGAIVLTCSPNSPFIILPQSFCHSPTAEPVLGRNDGGMLARREVFSCQRTKVIGHRLLAIGYFPVLPEVGPFCVRPRRPKFSSAKSHLPFAICHLPLLSPWPFRLFSSS